MSKRIQNILNSHKKSKVYKAFLFFKKKKSNNFSVPFVAIVLFFLLVNSLTIVMAHITRNEGSNYRVCANSATVAACYDLSPTPTLNWTYTKTYVTPIDLSLSTHLSVRTGTDQGQYSIRIDNNSGFGSITHSIPLTNGADTSYTVPSGSLNFNTTYYWQLEVRDVTYDSHSDWLDGDSFDTPPICAPASPSLRSSNNISCSSARIRWTDSSVNEDSFVIDVYDDDTNALYDSTTVAGSAFGVSGGNMSYDVDIAYDGVNLRYEIYATNTGGADGGGDSAVVDSTSNIVVPLCQPVITSVSTPNPSCNSVEVDWTDNSDNESQYVVYLENTNIPGHQEVNSGVLASGPAGARTYTFSPGTVSATDGVDWNVRVVVNNANVSAVSSAGELVTTPICKPDLLAAGLSSSACRNMTVEFTDNSINEDGYRINFSDSDSAYSFNDNIAANPGTGVVTHVNNLSAELRDGTSWDIEVYAWNDEAGGTHSTVSDMQEEDTILCAPTGLTISNSPTDCTRVELGSDYWTLLTDWTDNSINETDYYLEYENTTNAPGTWNNIVIPAGPVPLTTNDQYIAAGFLPSKIYSFRVWAENDNFTSTYDLPDVPTGVPHTLTACNANIKIINDDEYDCDCIDVVWTTDGVDAVTNDVDHYNLYRITTGNVYGDDDGSAPILSNISKFPTTLPNTFEYQDCDIVSGSVTYSYRIETCFNPACTINLSSYVEPLDGTASNPCQDLPRWEESR